MLLFDEPLSNLDAKLRVQMRDEIRDLQQRLAITTVYVTHDQEEAMAVSDRIAVMDSGASCRKARRRALPPSGLASSSRGSSAAPTSWHGRVCRPQRSRSKGVRDRPGVQAGPPARRVRLVVRPEMVELRDPAAGEGARPHRPATFLGEKTDYLVALGGATLQVAATDQYRRPPFDIGEPVGVHFHAEGIHVLG